VQEVQEVQEDVSVGDEYKKKKEISRNRRKKK